MQRKGTRARETAHVGKHLPFKPELFSDVHTLIIACRYAHKTIINNLK